MSGTGLKLSLAGEQRQLLKAEDGELVAGRMRAAGKFVILETTNNTLGEEAAAVIGEELTRHPQLQECLFSDFFTGRLKTEIPPALDHLFKGISAAGARLTVLNLADNAFGPVVAPTLVSFLSSPSAYTLQVLNLNNQGLGITGGTQIAKGLEATATAAKGAFKLRVFIAGRNRLETPTAKAFAKAFTKIGSLEEVSLPQNGIYPAGIQALAEAFRSNPRLKRVNLSDNTVKEEGAQALSDTFAELENLEEVRLHDCLLTSIGAAHIVQSLAQHPQLTHLHLAGNEIGPNAAIDFLHQLHRPDNSNFFLSLAENNMGSHFANVRETAAELAFEDAVGASDDDQGSLSDDDGYDAFIESGYEDCEDGDEEGEEEEDEGEAEEEVASLPAMTSPMRRDNETSSKPSPSLPNFSFAASNNVNGSPATTPSSASKFPSSSAASPSIFGGSSPTKSNIPFSFAAPKIKDPTAAAPAITVEAVENGGKTLEARVAWLWAQGGAAKAFTKLPKCLRGKEDGAELRSASILERISAEVSALEALAGLLAEVGGLQAPWSQEVFLGLARKGLRALGEGFPVPLSAAYYVSALYNHLAAKTCLLRNETPSRLPTRAPLQALLFLLAAEDLWRETKGTRPALGQLINRAPKGQPQLEPLLRQLSLQDNKENSS